MRLLLLLTASLVAAPVERAHAAPKPKQMPAAIAEQNAAKLQSFLTALQKVSSAEFVAYSFRRPTGESAITEAVPAEELTQLKKALSSLQALLPPCDALQKRVLFGWQTKLRLMDAQGKCIDTLLLSPIPWVKQSEIDKRDWHHKWSLPDADYDIFENLPSYQKCNKRAAKRLRSAPYIATPPVAS